MRTIFVFCIIQFSMVANAPVKAQSSSRLLDERVAKFAMQRVDIHVALQYLAIAYKVPIGLEMISEKEEGTEKRYFDLSLEKCSVRDILTAIVERDTRYQWKECDGVVNVFPLRKQDTFLDTKLPDFVVSNVTRKELILAIVDCPLVKEQTQKLGIALRNFVSLPAEDTQLRKFSLSLHNLAVREVLDEILKKGDGYYWLVQIYGSRYGGPDKYFMLTL